MAAGGNSRPIIIVKKKVGHSGHHGGAWKVAYADFVTAMMSLFIVLWLMNSSEKIKKAVAGYFNDPKGTATLMGTTLTGTGETVSAAAANSMQQLKERLESEIKAKKNLEKLSKQIEITVTSEGLRIELLEDKNGTFYQSGSPRLSPDGQELLGLLAGELKTLPNALLIEGHTDAAPYSRDANYGNWELSADRANSARRLMQQDGVREDQVTQVRGYADQLLRVKSSPFDASNRRISILVKNDGSPIAQLNQARMSVAKTGASQPDTKPPPPPPSGAAGELPAQKIGSERNVAPPSTATPKAVPHPGLAARLKAMLPFRRK